MQIIPRRGGEIRGGRGGVEYLFLPIKNPNDPLVILIGNPSLAPMKGHSERSRDPATYLP